MKLIFILLFLTTACTPSRPETAAPPPPPEFQIILTRRPTPTAAPEFDLTAPLGRFPGQADDIYLSDGRAYVSAGRDWLILDVTAPAQPVEIGRLTFERPVTTHLIDRGIAYVTDEVGLYLVDVAAGARPTRLGFLPTPTPTLSIAVHKNHAYLANSRPPGPLRFVDLTDPTQPQAAGSLPQTEQIWAVAARGDYLVVAQTTHTAMFDISAPTQPRPVGDINLAGIVTDIILTDRYAYTSNYAVQSAKVMRGGGLHIIDIGDPLRPVAVGYYEPQESGFMPSFKLLAVEDYAYLAGPNALWLLDISDPTSPAVFKQYRRPDLPHTLAAADGYIYLAAGPQGVLIFEAYNE